MRTETVITRVTDFFRGTQHYTAEGCIAFDLSIGGYEKSDPDSLLVSAMDVLKKQLQTMVGAVNKSYPWENATTGKPHSLQFISSSQRETVRRWGYANVQISFRFSHEGGLRKGQIYAYEKHVIELTERLSRIGSSLRLSIRNFSPDQQAVMTTLRATDVCRHPLGVKIENVTGLVTFFSPSSSFSA